MDNIECAAMLCGLCAGAVWVASCVCYGCAAANCSPGSDAQGSETCQGASMKPSFYGHGRSRPVNLPSLVSATVMAGALCSCLPCGARELERLDGRRDGSSTTETLNTPSDMQGTTGEARRTLLAKPAHQASQSKDDQISDDDPRPSMSYDVPNLQPVLQKLVDQLDLGTIQPCNSASGQLRSGLFRFSKGHPSHVFTEAGLPNLLMALAIVDASDGVNALSAGDQQELLNALDMGESTVAEALSGPLPRQTKHEDANDGKDRSQNQRRNLQLDATAGAKPNTQYSKWAAKLLNWSFANSGHTQIFWLFIQAPGVWSNRPRQNKFIELFTKCFYQAGVAGWDLRKKTLVPAFVSGRWTPRVWESSKKKIPVAVQCLFAKFNNMENVKSTLGFRFELHFDMAGAFKPDGTKILQFYIRVEAGAKSNLMCCWLGIAHAVREKQEAEPIDPEGVLGFDETLDDQAVQLYNLWLSPERQAAIATKLRLEGVKRAFENKLQQFGPGYAGERDEALLEAAREEGVNIEFLGDKDYRINLFVEVQAEIDTIQPNKPWGKVLRITERVLWILQQLGLRVGIGDGRTIPVPPGGMRQLQKLNIGRRFQAQILKQSEAVAFGNLNCALGPSVTGLYLDTGFVLLLVVTFPWGKPLANPTSANGIAEVPLIVYGWSIQILGNRTDVNTNGSFGITIK